MGPTSTRQQLLKFNSGLVLFDVYVELLAFGWPNRETPAGQALLRKLRDALADAANRSEEAVQTQAEEAALCRKHLSSIARANQYEKPPRV